MQKPQPDRLPDDRGPDTRIDRHDGPRQVPVLGAWGFVQVYGTPDQRLEQLADRQNGRVSRQQLLAAGLTPSMLQTRAARRSLIAVHAGVYAVGHRRPTPLGRETASLLASGPGAALSHLTAAIAIWELLPDHCGISRPDHDAGRSPDHDHGPDEPIDVTILSGDRGRKRDGIRIHRSRTLSAADIRLHRDLPVTTPARTILDMADVVTPRELERALDEALARRLVSRTKMRDQLATAGPRPGTRHLAELIAQRAPSALTRSEAEERFLTLIRQARLPAPEVNVPLCGYVVDFLWRDAGVVVEVDGYQWHSTKSARERDHRKTAALDDAGLDVNRVTWDQINHESLALVTRLARKIERGTARSAA